MKNGGMFVIKIVFVKGERPIPPPRWDTGGGGPPPPPIIGGPEGCGRCMLGGGIPAGIGGGGSVPPVPPGGAGKLAGIGRGGGGPPMGRGGGGADMIDGFRLRVLDYNCYQVN